MDRLMLRVVFSALLCLVSPAQLVHPFAKANAF